MSKSLLDEYVAVDVTLINDLYLRSTERVRSSPFASECLLAYPWLGGLVTSTSRLCSTHEGFEMVMPRYCNMPLYALSILLLDLVYDSATGRTSSTELNPKK